MHVCSRMIDKVAFQVCSSLYKVAIVAMQGVYNKVNVKNANALVGCKRECKEVISAPSWLACIVIASDDTMDSLAIIPVNKEVVKRQSAHPKGSNRNDKLLPIAAKIL